MRLNKKDRALLRRIINFIVANKKEITYSNSYLAISGMCLIPVFLQKRRFSCFSQLDYPDGQVFLKGERKRFLEIVRAYKPVKNWSRYFYFKPFSWDKRIDFLKDIINED